MATDMEASMFSMISMFNMHVHACVHVHVCMNGTLPNTPISIPTQSTHLPPLRGGPRESVKIW